VVRFAGGHQVGHTVQLDGFRHTFSHFGAGTLRGIASYYGPGTTVFPPGMLREHREISWFQPRLVWDPRAQVTTPYDMAWNRATETLKRHGSCGVGYGATVQRQQAGISFAVKDLAWDWAAARKLEGVKAWYGEQLARAGSPELEKLWQAELEQFTDEAYLKTCRQARELVEVRPLADLLPEVDELILEGNQGIPLDREEGFYPHLSWSRTTSLAAMELLEEAFGSGPFADSLASDPVTDTPAAGPAEVQPFALPESLDFWYVSRCYQTRHGAGPLSSSQLVELVNADNESNTENPWQGPFRTAELDPALLLWSLDTDQPGWRWAQRWLDGARVRRHLVLTCLDQRPDFSIPALLQQLPADFTSTWGSHSPESRDFRPLKSQGNARADG